MERLAEYSGLKLIKKYGYYYIRFHGGEMEDLPCDLVISNKEAYEAMKDKKKIKDILYRYMKKVPWTKEHFINAGIEDYLALDLNLSDDKVRESIKTLNRHIDIKKEMYETLMFDSFPTNGAIKVCGYSAEGLFHKLHFSILDAYHYLIYLREDQNHALEEIKYHLPIRSCSYPYKRRLQEIDATYVWNAERGGFQMIMNDQGERLIATSAITFEKLYQDFCSGKRNPQK